MLQNFDEAEHTGKKELLFMFVCVLLYTGCSYLFGWFDRNPLVTGLFALFMLGSFWCMFLANKIKRVVDKQNGDLH